jgi:hypothetical protein
MKTGRPFRGNLVGGFIVLAMVIAPLVLVNIVSVAASPAARQVQAVPVPTPPPVQPAEASSPAPVAARPAPMPVPTPSNGGPAPDGQLGTSPALLLLALPALAVTGLAAVQRQAGGSAEAASRRPRATTTPCQECG